MSNKFYKLVCACQVNLDSATLNFGCENALLWNFFLREYVSVEFLLE